MTEAIAANLAETIGGQAWHSGGGIWLVRATTKEGHILIVAPNSISTYATEEDYYNGTPLIDIDLS